MRDNVHCCKEFHVCTVTYKQFLSRYPLFGSFIVVRGYISVIENVAPMSMLNLLELLLETEKVTFTVEMYLNYRVSFIYL